ncbi:MAG: hypothetical protein QM696_11805 [Steroidobacteraceae bacterium]
MIHLPHDDAHDLGLAHDLEVISQRAAERRRLLGAMLGGGTLALLAGCGGDGDATASSGSSSGSTSGGTSSGTGTGSSSSGSGSSSSGSGSSSSSGSSDSCVADPPETNGPYPSDGSNSVNGVVSNVLLQSGVVRSDIRSSFGSASGTAAGVPLTLEITLVNTNASCAVLSGWAIYLWHCTRDGVYSLYSGNALNENFLRGVQASDSSGKLSFTTIFPGCYSGRYPHIHFEVYQSLGVATGYANRVLTSQMALPRDVCSTVYSTASGYASSVSNLNGVTIASDNVFGDNTAAQIAAQTIALTGNVADGYNGTIVVGVPW